MSGNESRTVVLSRQELYDRIWTAPITHLADEYGVSSVDVTKACDKHQIPRPPVGYWTQKQFGKHPSQDPLPAGETPDLQTITLFKTERKQAGAKEPPLDDDIIELLQKAKALPPIQVGSTLKGSHPLIKRTRDVLSRSELDKYGLTCIPWTLAGSALNVCVGRRSVRRALLFLDILLKAVERLGGTITVEMTEDKRSSRTIINFAGERAAAIRVRERYNRVRNDTKGSGHYSWREYSYKPSGHLGLDCNSSWHSHRYEESDRWGQMEQQVNKALIWFIEMAADVRATRKKKEEEQRRREVWEKEREAKLPLIKREETRLAELKEEVKAWHQAERMRHYIHAVRSRALAEDGSIGEDSDLHKWLIWAEQQADRLDPLVESPDSILDEKEKYQRSYNGW